MHISWVLPPRSISNNNNLDITTITHCHYIILIIIIYSYPFCVGERSSSSLCSSFPGLFVSVFLRSRQLVQVRARDTVNGEWGGSPMWREKGLCFCFRVSSISRTGVVFLSLTGTVLDWGPKTEIQVLTKKCLWTVECSYKTHGIHSRIMARNYRLLLFSVVRLPYHTLTPSEGHPILRQSVPKVLSLRSTSLLVLVSVPSY